MKRDFGPGTLQLTKPWGITLGLAFLIFLVYIALGEALFRSPMVRFALTAPSLGSRHRGLEEQISRLERFAANKEAIDCLFLGDSTVMTDFAPLVFERAYREQTGKDIDCFNFGLGATNVVSSAALAKILSEDYKPRLLIYGTQPLNFAVPSEAEDGDILLETPWIRYRLGQSSLQGWLFDLSYLYRYLGVLGQVIRLETERPILRAETEIQSGLRNGYYPMSGARSLDVTKVPQKESKHPYDQNYFYHLSSFQVLPENLAAFDEILALQGNPLQVLIVEMPVAENFLHYFGNGEQDYQAFIDTVERSASARRIPFLETSPLQMFSSEDWFNYNHLDPKGARIFSQWMGARLGNMIQGEK